MRSISIMSFVTTSLFGYDIESKKTIHSNQGWNNRNQPVIVALFGKMILQSESCFRVHRMFIDVYNTHDTLTQFTNFSRIRIWWFPTIVVSLFWFIKCHSSRTLESSSSIFAEAQIIRVSSASVNQTLPLRVDVCEQRTKQEIGRFQKVPVVIYPLHEDPVLKFIKKSFMIVIVSDVLHVVRGCIILLASLRDLQIDSCISISLDDSYLTKGRSIMTHAVDQIIPVLHS